jgi:hypothetical protein
MFRQRLTIALGVLLAGCESMESSGSIFEAAPKPAPPVAPADPAFAFPTEPPLTLSSEQLAGGDEPGALVAATGVDPDAVEPSAAVAAVPVAAAPVVVAAPAPAGLPTSTWPVRLVSTIPQAQPPRAILGLPSGEERVVSPGSILGDQGLVVMSVSGDRVQLAKVEPAGDHAVITQLELSAQYPVGH